MNIPAFFKRLVVVTTILYLFWLGLPWIQNGFVSQEASDALSWYGFDAVVPLPLGLAWLIALLYVPIAIGLCGFSPSARWVFVAFTVFGHVCSLLGGLRVETAFGATLGNILAMGDGAIIALAFMSPLRERFDAADQPSA